MIQDIQPHAYQVSYKNAVPDEDSLICIKSGGRILLKDTDGEIAFPTYAMVRDICDEYTYLFSVDNYHLFYAHTGTDVKLNGYIFKDRRAFRTLTPKHLAFMGVTACQIIDWYENNRFCGRCGRPMRHDGAERMMRCDGCGNMVYPKISPAVIVAVNDGDRLLMTKYAGRSSSPGYALVAGFAEVGESIEDTVRREVMEETGVRVKNITFYKSQPWSFTDTLLMGFFCELDGSDVITVDETELSVACWQHRDEIRAEYNDMSLTNEMICVFKHGHIYGGPPC